MRVALDDHDMPPDIVPALRWLALPKDDAHTLTPAALRAPAAQPVLVLALQLSVREAADMTARALHRQHVETLHVIEPQIGAGRLLAP